MSNTYYGNFRQITFSDCWNTAEEFVNEYSDSGLAPENNKITDDSAETLFYLLYSRYGNSVIASSDTNQFKYQVFSLIYEYGPTWEKKINLQKDIRDLTENDILTGSSAIYNHAYNPSTVPSTGSTTELTYINEQTVNKQQISILNAYAGLNELLANDVTGTFLTRFKKLFLQIVLPEKPLWYVSENEESTDGDDTASWPSFVER